MDKNIKEKWVAALRSGAYKQGYNCLRPDNNSFCCLGVLCDVIDNSQWEKNKNDFYLYHQMSSLLPDDILDVTKLSPDYARHLAELNDMRYTFEDISDFICKYV
jgi:hypothetical protein